MGRNNGLTSWGAAAANRKPKRLNPVIPRRDPRAVIGARPQTIPTVSNRSLSPQAQATAYGPPQTAPRAVIRQTVSRTVDADKSNALLSGDPVREQNLQAGARESVAVKDRPAGRIAAGQKSHPSSVAKVKPIVWVIGH